MAPKKRPYEVSAARKALKGALQGIISEKREVVDTKIRTKEAKRRRVEEKHVSVEQHPRQILKMFDRKLDLGRYDENTALFPIIRAWISNEEDSAMLPVYRGRKSPERVVRADYPNMIEDIKSGAMTEVTEMPAIKDDGVSRIPSLLPFQTKDGGERVEVLEHPTMQRDDIMREMKARWQQVRKKWRDQSRLYEKKYEFNFNVLDALHRSVAPEES